MIKMGDEDVQALARRTMHQTSPQDYARGAVAKANRDTFRCRREPPVTRRTVLKQFGTIEQDDFVGAGDGVIAERPIFRSPGCQQARIGVIGRDSERGEFG